MSVVASAHVADFESLRAAWAWRRRLAVDGPRVPGLRWAKAMTTLGDARKGGFAIGTTSPHRQFMIAAWESLEAFELFEADPRLALARNAHCRHAWHALLRPFTTRGSFHGETPFDGCGPELPADRSVGVLTIGRCSWRRLSLFTRQGAALTSSILGSAGLITALTAGFPVTGNATFSLWQRTEDMRRFAFYDAHGHRAVIETDRRRRILEEQIAVRFSPIAIRGTWDPLTTPNSVALHALADRLSSVRSVA